ncbi:MAG: hypothetical protein IPG20_14330 [Gammaproteobacteria bacterium]|nr:hypothetical protein [Gammaproteobacteria bacterium]MBK9665252.1 hypothetical protein [Gammaproteobacteria bacterium]
MPPKLYLHIGINKTGTSAIQRYLSSHRAELVRESVLYPVTGRAGEAHYGLSRALGFAHGKPPVNAQELERLRSALLEEMRASDAQSVILSSEDFVLRGDIARVREFLSAFDCRIVVYLRRHDHWWLSSYNQAVKMVANPPWEPGINAYLQFCRKRKSARASHRELLERWAEVFGVPAICVRPYEAAQNEGGVVADFLRTTGLAELAAGAAGSSERVNESLAGDVVHILDLVQRARISPRMRETLKIKLLAERVAAPAAAVDLMRPRLRRRLIEENRPDYEYIARTFLGREDGVLFREPEPRGDEAWEAPPLPDKVAVIGRILNLLDDAG